MLFRKQKKWLEFFIRLLPVFAFVFGLIINIFNNNQANNLDLDISNIFNNSLNLVNEFFGFFNNSSSELVFSNFYTNLFEWLSEYLDLSFIGGKIIYDFLFYQLLISIVLLFFDFLNFIIDFARQFIGGFYAKEK